MTTSKNDVTGDLIKTKTPSDSYRDNYDSIFRSKEKKDEEPPSSSPEKEKE